MDTRNCVQCKTGDGWSRCAEGVEATGAIPTAAVTSQAARALARSYTYAPDVYELCAGEIK